VIGRVLQGAANLLDLPGSMARDALAWRNPVDQVMTPFSDQNRTTGRGLLRRYGAIGDQDTWGNYAGGMAAEMVLDPTNLVGAGLLGKYAKAASGVGKANKAIDAGNALSLQQRAMGFMPEEIAKQTKIVDPSTGLPKTMYHGTREVFDQYDPTKADPNALYGSGYYTTDSPRVATSYPDARGPYAHEEWAFKPESRDQILKAYANMEDYADPTAAWQSMNRRVRDKGPRSEFATLLDDELPGGIQPHLSRTNLRVVAPANVRMQYIDARKPFDMESKFTAADFPDDPEIQSHIGGVINSVVSNRQRLQEQLEYMESMLQDLKSTSLPYNPQRIASLEKDLAGTRMSLESANARIANPYATGDEIYKAYGNETRKRVLEPHGYDAITHKGGQNIGGLGDHNVTIAFDPSQVYKPYIAPALQNQLPLPAPPTRTLRALGAANLARGGRKQ
jgi:hypothetical protein